MKNPLPRIGTFCCRLYNWPLDPSSLLQFCWVDGFGPHINPASDTLYQPGHHGVWRVLSKLPNALVTNSSTCYNFTSVATSVPATAYHLAFAQPGPAQTLPLQGPCLQPIPPPLATTLDI